MVYVNARRLRGQVFLELAVIYKYVKMAEF